MKVFCFYMITSASTFKYSSKQEIKKSNKLKMYLNGFERNQLILAEWKEIFDTSL